MKNVKRVLAAALAAAMTAPACVAVPVFAASGVMINEVCTQNKTCFTDSNGEASDWIELYNPGDSPADLSGCGISDQPDTVRYTFPHGTSIPAGGYLVIAAAKGEGAAEEYRTGFSLSKSGEQLILTDASGGVIESLDIPALAEDETYGRSPDGSDSFAVMRPSPGTSNLMAAVPEFSLEPGFYQAQDGLTLSINCTDTVYYTLDSSDPTTSSTAQIYSGAIPMYDRSSEENVYSKYQHEDNSPYSTTLMTRFTASSAKFDKATVVRAASKSADGTFSPVVTATYFVMPQDKLDYYKDIPVVSLVTDPANLFDKDKGIYVCGQQYLDWKNSPQYNPAKSEWDTDNAANFFSKGKEWEREASVTLFRDGEQGFTQNMGIRIKGASTRNSQAKSFNVYARSSYGDSKLNYDLIEGNVSADDSKEIKKYDSFSLRSVTWVDRMREAVIRPALKDMPALAGYDSNRCMLFLDGELWGMYDIIEKSSGYYIQSNYGVPAEDVAMVKNGELEEGSDSDLDELEALSEFCEKNDMSVQSNYDYVAARVDTESLIDCYAVGLYLGTWDWPNHNYLMWRSNGQAIEGNPYSDGKWRCGSFDFDYAAGLTYASFGGVEGYAHDSFRKFDQSKNDFPSPIFTSLLKNDSFRQRFADTFCSMAYSVFEAQKMKSIISDQESRYMKYMTMCGWRWNNGTPRDSFEKYISDQGGYYSKELAKMTTFFERRADYAIEDMREYLGIRGDSATITVTRTGMGTVTAGSDEAVFSDSVWTGSFSEGSEVTLTAKAAPGYRFEGWRGAVTSSDETIKVKAGKAVALTAVFAKTEAVRGDINADGIANAADLVLLSRYLLGSAGFSKAQWKAADINTDGTADTFDLVRLRSIITG